MASKKFSDYSNVAIPADADIFCMENAAATNSQNQTYIQLVNDLLKVTRGGTGTTTEFTLGSVVFAGASGVYTEGNIFWDDTNNRLGLGTTSPASIVHIYENTASVDASVGLTIEQDGTGDALCQFLLTGGQRWVMGVDNDSGDRFKIASDEDLATNTRFLIETNGNVGIGKDDPISILHLYQNITNIGGSAGLTIEQEGTGDAICHFLLTGGERWIMGIDNNSADSFKIGNGANLGANDRMTILTTGETGIGTKTPDAQLEVNHATGNCLRLTYNDPDGGAANYCQFDMTSSGDLGILPSSGKTGIGTATPASALDVSGGLVVGATRAGTTAAPTNGLLVEGLVGMSAVTSPEGPLHIHSETNGTRTYYFGNSSNNANAVILNTRKSRGTFASPTAVSSADILMSLSSSGYNGSAYASGFSLRARTTEAWSGAAQGTKAEFRVTRDGTTAVETALTIDSDKTLLFEELTNTVSATPSSAGMRLYHKADKIVFTFNDAGTQRYKYLDLTGTGVTWVHTTSAP